MKSITTMINTKFISTMKQVMNAVSPIHFKYESAWYSTNLPVRMEGLIAEKSVDC